MLCKVDGCRTDAMYTAQCVCQKHYFRFMRNGSYALKERKPKLRYENRGYQSVMCNGHPLAHANGVVAEHRKVVYDHYGENLPDCELCGEIVKWETCHIDHIDCNPRNNSLENLRPVCRGCNTGRTPRKGVDRYEHAGLFLSLLQWEKPPGVTGTRSALRNRLKNGMSIEQALFARNHTHPKSGIVSSA
jgi:5-methylcytosine-specific restriction endonuclease McrA